MQIMPKDTWLNKKDLGELDIAVETAMYGTSHHGKRGHGMTEQTCLWQMPVGRSVEGQLLKGNNLNPDYI